MNSLSPSNYAHTPVQFGTLPTMHMKLGEQVRSNVDAILSLKEVFHRVAELEVSFAPIDSKLPLNYCHVDFTDPTPTLRFVHPSSTGFKYKISRHALKQLAALVTPKSKLTKRRTNIFHLTHAMWDMDEEAKQILTLQWSKLLQNSTKEVLFRSRHIHGERVFIAVQGEKYAPVSDTKVLKKLVDEFGDLPVAGIHITDQVSNFRILMDGDAIQVGKPVEMLDIYNSPAGMRGLWIYNKVFELVCTNGMGHTTHKGSWMGRHYGDPDALMGRFALAIPEVSGAMTQFIEAYNKAREITVENMYNALKFRMDRSFTENEIQNAIKCSNDIKLIASPQNTVGHWLDSITLSAQMQSDPIQRESIESKASELMCTIIADVMEGIPVVPKDYGKKELVLDIH